MWHKPLEMKESLLLEGTSAGSSCRPLAIRIDVNSDVLPGKWTGKWPAATHYQPITRAGVMKRKKPAGDIRAKDSLRARVCEPSEHISAHTVFPASVSAPVLLWIWPIFFLLLVSSAFVKRDKSRLWQLAQCCSHKLMKQTRKQPSTVFSDLMTSAQLLRCKRGFIKDVCNVLWSWHS